MKTVTATYAKQNFGACIADASVSPIIIEKTGRPSAVMMGIEEYRWLQDLEDAFWLAKAEAAEAEGFLSVQETEAFMAKKLAEAKTR